MAAPAIGGYGFYQRALDQRARAAHSAWDAFGRALPDAQDFLPRDANDSAIALQDLAAQLGYGRWIRGQEPIKPSWAEPLKDYLRRMTALDEVDLEPPPTEVVALIDAEGGVLDRIDATLASEPALQWEFEPRTMDLEEPPFCIVALRTHQLLLTRAIVAHQRHDHATRDASLWSAARLSAGVLERVELLSVVLGIELHRQRLSLQRRLTLTSPELDIVPTPTAAVRRALEFEAWHLYQGGRHDPPMLQRFFHNPRARRLSYLMLPQLRIAAFATAKEIAAVLAALAAWDGCEVSADRFTKPWRDRAPLWNLWFNPANYAEAWARARRLEIEAALSLNVTSLYRQRELANASVPGCPKARWQVDVTDDAVRIALDPPLGWQPARGLQGPVRFRGGRP